MSKVWNNIGSFRIKSNGKKHFVFEKGVTILKDGVEIDLGQYRSAACFDAKESLEKSIANNKITPENAQKSLEYIQDKNIVYDVSIPPVVVGDDN